MNVVLFVSDALRADHLSCYGYDRRTSPFLDRFADEHVRYEHAYTPVTWTRASAASLLTGTYPSVHGVKTLDDRCSTNLPRAPEVFQRAGYETAAVSAIGNMSSELGFERGFDTFVDLYRSSEVDSDRPTSTAEAELLSHESGKILFPEGEYVVDRFVSSVLERPDSEPFFSLLWTIDTHDPFRPPAGHGIFTDDGYDGPISGTRESLRDAKSEADFQRLRNLYDSEVRYVDTVFESLIEALQQYGVYDDTVVAFTSDHGEALGDHGGNVGHGHVPYEELLRVPLVVRYPEQSPEWNGNGDLVSLIDIFPTLLEYCELPSPASLNHRYTGRSVIDGGRDAVFSETDHSSVQNGYYSVRLADWKYIEVEPATPDLASYLEVLTDIGFMKQFLRNPVYFLRRRFGSESAHLYDLESDPEETENLADRSDELDRLRTMLDQWRETVSSVDSAETDGSAPELTKETERQLREMGYI